MKIIADDKIPFLKGVFEPYADIVYLPGEKIDSQSVSDADALIVRTRTHCNQKLLEGSKVKFIVTATIGYDHIDTKWCEQNGIIWKNAEGCNSGSVKQYIASSLAWLSVKHNFKFEDKTLGIIGVGNVGKRVMKVGEALGMRIVLNDPPLVRKSGQCGFISLDGVMREADIISLHVPLNIDGQDKTYHLFDEKNIGKLMKNAILINASRGEVVDNQALKEALKSYKIEAAVLDVWENEPAIDTELLSLVDLATPHIAGYSADGKANGTTMSVHALSNFFRLPLSEWKPNEIPVNGNLEIEIDCSGKSNDDVLREAILKTYNIEEDSKYLKSNIALFEQYRGQYPIRREFANYKLKLFSANKELTDKLHWLGFKIY